MVRRQGQHAKIADVARLAGVSVATVSRALATPDVVSDDARRRVAEAVRATGYRANAAARNLRARRTMLALVVVPDIGNPFFAEVLRGVDDALSNRGYGLIIANLDNAPDKEQRYVDLTLSGQVDGVLLLCGHIPQAGGRSMSDAGVPLVAACERIPGALCPQVEIDNRAAAALAVRHLATLGHRRIAYVSGPRANILDRDRSAGYADGLAEAGLPSDSAVVLSGDFTFRSGAAAATQMLSMPPLGRPTAVFAANDEMAIGFLKTVHAAGLRVPADLSIVGFDAVEYADYCEPTLTTVSQPRRAIGARAADLLVGAMTGADAGPSHVVLDATLRIRESSAPPQDA